MEWSRVESHVFYWIFGGNLGLLCFAVSRDTIVSVLAVL